MSTKSRFFIISAKKWIDYYPLQVVYEWENIISEKLSIPIDYDSQAKVKQIYDNRLNNLLQKVVRSSFLWRFIDSSFNYYKRRYPGQYIISFLLNPIPLPNHYVCQENSVVVLLDVFTDSIDMIPKWFKNNLIFVTNIEVLNYFKSHPIHNKLRYIPLSISDQYYDNEIPEKKIDVLQMGRQNVVLHDWMLKLVEKHPEVEYVYAKKENGINVYFSTTKGLLPDKTDTRQQFMDFLGCAKVSLLSAPGIDGGELLRTGGFNPVTPRFYESAVKYCYMVGRYPDTPDFIKNNISSVCERSDNYEDFEKMILKMIKTPFDQKAKYDIFIKQHLTSTVAETMKHSLDKLN
jgi:hypothetical protein